MADTPAFSNDAGTPAVRAGAHPFAQIDAGLIRFVRFRLILALCLIAASLFAGWLANLPLHTARVTLVEGWQAASTLESESAEAAAALHILGHDGPIDRAEARPALALAAEEMRAALDRLVEVRGDVPVSDGEAGAEGGSIEALAAAMATVLPAIDRLVSLSVNPLGPEARDEAQALNREIRTTIQPWAARQAQALRDRVETAEDRANLARPIILAMQLLALTLIALVCFRASLTRIGLTADARRDAEARAASEIGRMRAQNERLEAIFDVAVAGIIATDSNGILRMVNPLAARMFGYRSEELIGRNVNLLMPTNERAGHDTLIELFAQSGQADILGRPREVRGQRRSGEVFPVYIAVDLVRLGGEAMFVGVMLDISQQKDTERQLIDRETKLNQAEAIAKLGHFELEPETGRMLASETVFTILGLERDAPLSEDSFRLMLHADDRDRWRGLMADLSWQSRVIEVRQTAEAMTRSPRELRITLQRTREGARNRSAIFGILQDVSELRAMERELRSLSTVDPMCQVANRRHLGILADQEMERSRRYRRSLAVVLVSIDDFPRVNLTHGHRVGDNALRAISETLKTGLRGVDHVGRVGGAKFCIILPETEEPGARVVAERLRLAIGLTAIRGEMSRFHVTASMAVVWRRDGDDDFHTLLSRGELLLAEAQAAGGDRVLDEMELDEDR